MPVRYDIRYSMMYIVFGTHNNRSGHKREIRVYMSAEHGKMFYILFFRDLNSTFIPLVVLIVFQLKTKPSEDCSLSTNLSSYFSYQVHRLLRRKSAIRLCVFTAHKCHGNTRYTHTHIQAYTHIRGNMIITMRRWKSKTTARKLRWSWCLDANEWNQNQLFEIFDEIVFTFSFFVVLYFLLVFSLFSLFYLCTEREHLQMRCHKNTFTFTYQKIDGKMIPYLCRLR